MMDTDDDGWKEETVLLGAPALVVLTEHLGSDNPLAAIQQFQNVGHHGSPRPTPPPPHPPPSPPSSPDRRLAPPRASSSRAAADRLGRFSFCSHWAPAWKVSERPSASAGPS